MTGRKEHTVRNQQIIEEIARRVFGQDAVEQMLMKGEDIPLHTLQGWRSQGPYSVKKGEHGIETRLWKRKKDGSGETVSEDENSFYLAKSYLFTKDQVTIEEQ